MAQAQADNVASALGKVFESDPNPRFRARALGVLAKIASVRTRFITAAVKDKNSDIRIAGLRLARQKLPSQDQAVNTEEVVGILTELVSDSAAEVRRECALALRLLKPST